MKSESVDAKDDETTLFNALLTRGSLLGTVVSR